MAFEVTPEQRAAMEATIAKLPPGTKEQAAFQSCLVEPLQLAFREIWLRIRVPQLKPDPPAAEEAPATAKPKPAKK